MNFFGQRDNSLLAEAEKVRKRKFTKVQATTRQRDRLWRAGCLTVAAEIVWYGSKWR